MENKSEEIRTPFSGPEIAENSVEESPTKSLEPQAAVSSSVLPNTETKVERHSLIFLAIAVILFIGGFFAGIAVGYQFQTPRVIGDLVSAHATEFNTVLMLYVWIGTSVLGLALLGVSWHLKNQETMIEKLNELIEK